MKCAGGQQPKHLTGVVGAELAARPIRVADGVLHHYPFAKSYNFTEEKAFIAGSVWHVLKTVQIAARSLKGGVKPDLTPWTVGVFRKFGAILRNRGIHPAMNSIKELFVSLRRGAVQLTGRVRGETYNHPNLVPHAIHHQRRILHQISRCGRALPEGDEVLANRALLQHKKDLAVPATSRNREKRLFRVSCREIFQGRFRGSYRAISQSASNTMSKENGGQAAELKCEVDLLRNRLISYEQMCRLHDVLHGNPLLQGYRVTSPFAATLFTKARGAKIPFENVSFEYDASYEISSSDWLVIRENLFLVAHCIFVFMQNKVKIPSCRQSVIKERGWKVRIVTPGESYLLYLCGIVNKFLLGCIERHGPSASSQKGRPIKNLDWSFGVKGLDVRSADLTSATDLMTHDLIREGVLEIFKSTDICGFLELVLLKATGTHRMVCKDLSVVLTKRGTLMGNPVSWPLLAAYTTMLHKASGSRGWYATVGDDYVGCLSPSESRKWDNALSNSGGKLSVPKDLYSRKGYGVLAEELFSVPRRRCYSTCSIRAAAGVSRSDTPLWDYGPTLSTSLDALTPEGISEVVHATFGTAIERLKRAEIDPFGPRFLGGAGFPGGQPNAKTWKIARGLKGQSRAFVIDKMARFGSLWSRTLSDEYLRDFAVDFVNKLVSEFGQSASLEDGGQTISEILSEYSARRASMYLLAYGSKVKPLLQFSKVVQRATQVIQDILKVSYWVPDEELKDSGSLLASLLATEPRFTVSTIGWGRELSVSMQSFQTDTHRPFDRMRGAEIRQSNTNSSLRAGQEAYLVVNFSKVAS